MPLEADGTVVGQMVGSSVGPAVDFPSQAIVQNWVLATSSAANAGDSTNDHSSIFVETFCFFPETRTCLGVMWATYDTGTNVSSFEGSTDSGNGSDGTWEAASLPSGYPVSIGSTATAWRTGVKPCTFTVPKNVVRFKCPTSAGTQSQLGALHLYGVKASGQTPDDILFLDGDNAYAEFTIDKDWGDRALGTTVVKNFKIKNASATKTATTILVTCNDADFAISTDGVTYVTSFTIASLGAGVSSAVLYMRNTTPAPGTALGPRMAQMSVSVGSYV